MIIVYSRIWFRLDRLPKLTNALKGVDSSAKVEWKLTPSGEQLSFPGEGKV